MERLFNNQVLSCWSGWMASSLVNIYFGLFLGFPLHSVEHFILIPKLTSFHYYGCYSSSGGHFLIFFKETSTMIAIFSFLNFNHKPLTQQVPPRRPAQKLARTSMVTLYLSWVLCFQSCSCGSLLSLHLCSHRTQVTNLHPLPSCFPSSQQSRK